MVNSSKNYLQKRKDNIRRDFYNWKRECCTDLIKLDPFSQSTNSLFIQSKITVSNYNNIPTLKSWIVQDYCEDYQLSCHHTVCIDNTFYFGMHKIFDVSELPNKYGFENVNIYNTSKVWRLRLPFYIISLIYVILLATILPYLFSLFLLALVIYLLTFLDDNLPLDKNSNVPLELLYTLEKQGFTFQWRPRYKGKKIMVWYDKEGNLSLNCPKAEITNEERIIFLELFQGRDFNIKDKPYSILYYKLHISKDLNYSIHLLYNTANSISFNTILFNSDDIHNYYVLDFNTDDYTQKLNWLKYNKSEYKGFYLCAVKDGNFNYLAKVKLSSQDETLVLEDNLPWVQELVINNTEHEYNLNGKQKEHASRLEAYLKKVARGHKYKLYTLADLKDNPIEYANYLLRNITQTWLLEYLSNNIPPKEDDYYEFICDVLASIKDEKFTYLEKLQSKELYWFHGKRRVHI